MPLGRFLFAALVLSCVTSHSAFSQNLVCTGDDGAEFEANTVCGDGTIKASVFGSDLVIKTSTRMGGSIVSLTWKGKEFINSTDHGREMQSASSFNDLGSCYNPTEAGSSYDGYGKSTSQLIQFSAAGNRLTSTSHPAYWRNCVRDIPNYPNANDPLIQSTIGPNGLTKASDHTFSKDVTIGFQGQANIIAYRVKFQLPRDFAKAVFEPLTAYMPTSTVSEFFRYAPDSPSFCPWPQLCPLPDNGEVGSAQRLPVIISSPDGEYAMGIYAPDIFATSDTTISGREFYNIFRSANGYIAKWNTTFVEQEVTLDEYPYTQFVIVGSKLQVKEGIDFIYSFYKQNKSFIKGYVDGITRIGSSVYLDGWACAQYTKAPVRVDLYIGGPAGTGLSYGSYTANITNEGAIAEACQVSGDHRFRIPLSAGLMQAHAGKAVYVYGISPTGLGNPPLSNSGTVVVPAQ